MTKARKSNRKAAPRPPADVEMADVLFQATLRQYAPLTAEDIRGLTVPEIRQLWLQRHERSETSGGRPTKLTPPSPPPRPKTQPQRPKQRPNPSRPQSRLRPPLEEPPLKKWLFDAVVRYPQSAKESRSAYARRLRDNSPPHLKKLDWETFRNNLYTLRSLTAPVCATCTTACAMRGFACTCAGCCAVLLGHALHIFLLVVQPRISGWLRDLNKRGGNHVDDLADDSRLFEGFTPVELASLKTDARS